MAAESAPGVRVLSEPMVREKAPRCLAFWSGCAQGVRGLKVPMMPRKTPRKREYHPSGLYTLARRLDADPDPASALGQAIRERRAALIADLGGADAVSEAQRLLVDAVVRSSMLLAAVDEYIATMGSPVNRQKRQLFAVIVQRMQIADSLGRSLERLGLERRARDVADIRQRVGLDG